MDDGLASYTDGFKMWLRLHLPSEISFGPALRPNLRLGLFSTLLLSRVTELPWIFPSVDWQGSVHPEPLQANRAPAHTASWIEWRPGVGGRLLSAL